MTNPPPPSTVERSAFLGASWLALFRFVGQALSWTTTVVVARILDPSDYGLVEMAIIIPKYAMTLSNLGLGPSIIQRPNPSQFELSSIFWFSVIFSLALAASSFFAAPLAVWLFNEPKLLAMTQVVSLLFVIEGLRVVPGNLIHKKLDFKKAGQIEIVSVIVSCTSMLLLASNGSGAWTLICGFFAHSGTQLLLSFLVARWAPSLHFRFSDIRPFLTFGIQVSLQGTLFFVTNKSDSFFAGRAWSASMLGHYLMALQLAQIPSEKITVLINHVAFPAFSLLHSDIARFRAFYLKTIAVTATLVFPLFVGGFLVGAELIPLLLSDKWSAIGRIFQLLCLAQIPVSLNAINNFVHNALGRAGWSSWNTAVSAALIPVSFFLAVPFGLEAAVIPWFTTYVVLSAGWTVITIRSIGISVGTYLKTLKPQIAAAFAMVLAVGLFDVFATQAFAQEHRIGTLIVKIGIGAVSYITVLWLTNREIIADLRRFRQS